MVRSVRRLTSREAVLRTLDLHDRFAADEFLHRYGFGRSHRYRLLHGGREYDSKAVAGVALRLQHPDLGPLRSEEFSGGASGAAYVLRCLGFDVVDIGGAPARAASPTLRQAPTVAELPASSRPPCAVGTGRRLLLLGCVKTKGPSAAPARDLYTSDLFDKRRRYAEASGLPWYVLSALHGLVLPHQVLEPYDMALKDQPRSYRTRWVRTSSRRWRSKLDRWTASRWRSTPAAPTPTPSGARPRRSERGSTCRSTTWSWDSSSPGTPVRAYARRTSGASSLRLQRSRRPS